MIFFEWILYWMKLQVLKWQFPTDEVFWIIFYLMLLLNGNWGFNIGFVILFFRPFTLSVLACGWVDWSIGADQFRCSSFPSKGKKEEWFYKCCQAFSTISLCTVYFILLLKLHWLKEDVAGNRTAKTLRLYFQKTIFS